MKLSHARGATQDGQVMVERFDRTWSTGEGNGKPLQYSSFQGTLMSLLQHHSSKASILRHSAFFTVQLSHPYMTIGKGGQEELPHIRDQGWWPGGATPRPRSSACMGTGGPTRATPHSRSGGATMRRYPSSKVRSSGCALLEQL